MNSKNIQRIDCRDLLSSLPLPACTVKLPDVTVTDCNSGFEAISGLPLLALRGKRFPGMAADAKTDLLQQLAVGMDEAPRRIYLAGKAHRMRMTAKQEDNFRLLCFEPESCECPYGNTEANQAMADLGALMNNAPVGILYSKDRRVVRFNNAFLKMFCCDAGLAMGHPTPAFYPSESAYRTISEQASPLLLAGLPFRQEMLMRRMDGTLFWADAVAYLIKADDPPLGSIWIINDISARKAAEQALQEALLETQAILDNAAVGMLFSRDKIIQRCNQRIEEIFGYSPGELVGLPATCLYPNDESYAAIGAEASPLLSAGRPFMSEREYRRKNGTSIWCRVYAKAVDPAHTDRGTVWLVEDITETRANQLTLEQTLREREALMNNAPVGILVTKERKILQYNQHFARMFGYTGSVAIGHPARELYRSDEEYEALGAKVTPLLSAAQPSINELYMRHQDGYDLWVNLIGYVADNNETNHATFWILEDRTDFKRAEIALAEAYTEQTLIFEHSVVGIAFIKNRVIQRCNRRYEEIYGFAPGELIGQSTRISYPSDQNFDTAAKVVYETLGRGETYIREFIHLRPSGAPIWIRLTGNAIDPAFPNEGSIWNVEDITIRKAAEESIRESELLQRAILDSAKLMILSTDAEGSIISSNPATQTMLGLASEDLIGRRVTEVLFNQDELAAFRLQRAQDLLLSPIQNDMEALLTRPHLGLIEQSEWHFRHADGHQFPVELSISNLYQESAAKTGFLFVASDISERKAAELALRRAHDELELRVTKRTAELESEIHERRRAESRLRFQVTHDALTRLPNRALLQQRIRNAMADARCENSHFALLFIDLDRFKTINDSLGHSLGDKLIKQVATRLGSCMRQDDTLARLGGDDFVALIRLGKYDTVGLCDKVNSILDLLRPPFQIDHHKLFVSASIGVCVLPFDGKTVETLMRNADTALYRAKANGRNTFALFEAGMTTEAENYLSLESELRHGLEYDQFVVHFQPIVNITEHKVAIAEALVRWQHPSKGLLAPGHFIGVAEDSGLIGQLGQIVLYQSCRQLRAWINDGWAPPIIAINLSPIQFRDQGLIDGILSTLSEFQLSPSLFELEITETTLMQDGELTLATLEQLEALGFHLSIDDFGTGYSSLAYLKRFPVHTLKIDRTFVTDMTHGINDLAIVSAIIGLARNLGLNVIAEGVETSEQFKALDGLGCDYVQGYLLSRPLPPEGLREYANRLTSEKASPQRT